MKRKGFTLIELLAVIVILAVISIIAVPLIGNVIEETRKKAFQTTCNEVYRSYEQYEMMEEINGSTGDCTIFEFGNERKETELIEGIKYEPVSKLSLKGELPESGTYKICNGKRELVIDNGEYTCVIDENRNEILNGKVEENDITNPIIEGINLNSTTNSIRVTVNGKEEDGVIIKYYYSINGEEYKESELNEYRYEGLETNKEYEIKVVVENASGLKSEEKVEKITTKEIVVPDIKEISRVPESGYEYATERKIEITYQTESIENPEYYFKSSVTAKVEEGIITGICELETDSIECSESSVTTIEVETWYKTNSTNPQITYEENGTLYALVSDGKNITEASTMEVTKIDTNIPEVKAEVDGKEVTFTMTDNIGVIAYGINQSDTEEPSYTPIESTTNIEKTWIAPEAGDYVVRVKDVSGRTNKYSFTIDESAFGAIVTYEVNGTKYEELHYNGTSVLSPTTFTPTLSDYEFVGWREDTTATSEVLTEKTMSGSPIILYAVFRQNVTVTYYNNSTTATTTSDYRYNNNGNIVNPSFTLTQTAKSGWSARGWSTGTAGNSAITYNNNTSFTRDSNITLYGMYQQTITVTYYNNSTTAATTTGTRYYNSGKNVYTNPSFTLAQATKSGWSPRGWSTGTAGNSGITYNNNTSFTRDSNITLYGMYQQTITLTYRQVSASANQTTNGTRYYNSNGAVVNPKFTLSPSGYGTEWTFRGWTTGTAANAGVTYASINNTEFSANTTVYVLLQRPVTLSYNGNGATSGSVSAETKYYYLNSYNGNTVLAPTFTLKANGFALTNCTFAGWNIGAVGASVTLSANTTASAQWSASTIYVLNNLTPQSPYTAGTEYYAANFYGSWEYTDYVSGKGFNIQFGLTKEQGTMLLKINQPIYITPAHKKLVFVLSNSYHDDNAGWQKNCFGVSATNPTSAPYLEWNTTGTSMFNAYRDLGENPSTGTYTIDVSALSGWYYISGYASCNKFSTGYQISTIYLSA